MNRSKPSLSKEQQQSSHDEFILFINSIILNKRGLTNYNNADYLNFKNNLDMSAYISVYINNKFLTEGFSEVEFGHDNDFSSYWVSIKNKGIFNDKYFDENPLDLINRPYIITSYFEMKHDKTEDALEIYQTYENNQIKMVIKHK